MTLDAYMNAPVLFVSNSRCLIQMTQPKQTSPFVHRQVQVINSGKNCTSNHSGTERVLELEMQHVASQENQTDIYFAANFSCWL